MHSPWDMNQARLALTQAAELLAAHATLIETEDATWFLEFEQVGGFMLEWSEELRQVVMTGELGEPRPENPLALMNIVLSFNAMWRENGGARVARDGDEGPLLLIAEVGHRAHDAHSLSRLLVHFESLRCWWLEVLSAPWDAQTGAASLDSLMLQRI